MKKRVNGKEVEVDISIFEKAAEDMIIDRKAENETTEVYRWANIDEVNRVIGLYNEFNKSLPYPLYYIDNDVRYCVAGLIIKKLLKEKCRVAIKDGLLVEISGKKEKGEKSITCIQFVNQSWGIEEVAVEDFDEATMNLVKYKESVGFAEFVWVATRWMKGEGTSGFYDENMKEFTQACNGEEVILRYELSNILEIDEVPTEKVQIPENMVVDVSTGSKYYLDIYYAGKREDRSAAGAKRVMNLANNTSSMEYRQVRVYEYNLYRKDSGIDRKNELSKVKDNKFGLTALFLKLNSLRAVHQRNEFPGFKGVVCGDYIVFEIEGRIYSTALNRPSETLEIASGMEIYAVDRNKCFISRSIKIKGHAKKQKIYSINCENGTAKLCRIDFISG